VLLVIIAISNDKVILPRDSTVYDKVYTFVRSSNTLYRGIKPIKYPAIPNLSGGSKPFKDGKVHSFSTMLRANWTKDARPAHFSMPMHFISFIRKW
jgi:hypothetical protein